MGNMGTSGGKSFSSFSETFSSAPRVPTVQEQHVFLDHAKRGEFEKLKRLLEANRGLINVQPMGRWTALHQFAQNGHRAAVEYLLDHNADPCATTRDGLTPADVAKPRELQVLLINAGSPLTDRAPATSSRGSVLPESIPPETVTMLRGVAPKRTEAEVTEAVREGGGDADLAVEALLRNPPPIRSEPEKWFHHFDLGGDGLLQENEVVVALCHTLPEEDKKDLENLLHRKWDDFDRDGTGALDCATFTESGGLRDWIVERWGEQLDLKFYECDDEEAGRSKDQRAKAELSAALAALEDDGVLGVYFTAHILNNFTSVLCTRYRKYRELGIPFSVLFVSVDLDQNSFEAHGSMDWRVVPFASRLTRQGLADRLAVKGVPQLVLVAKNGRIIAPDACSAVAADLEGSGFPWESGSAGTAAGPSEDTEEKVESALQTIMGKRRADRKVDDVEAARAAGSAPLSEEGYRKVAAFKSNYAMKRFIKRVIAVKQWFVLDDSNAELTRLAWEHSGVHGTKTLEHLLQDLRAAPWVLEADAHLEEPPPTASVTTVGPPNPGHEAPPVPGLTSTVFRHAFCTQRIRLARKMRSSMLDGDGEDKRTPSAKPHTEESPTSAAAGHKEGGTLDKVHPAASEEVAATGDEETTGAAAASTTGTSAPPAEGAGKSLGKGPAKGPGTGPGKGPTAGKGLILPATDGGDEGDGHHAPAPDGEEPALAWDAEPGAGKAPPAKAKGLAASGKGKKGPPPPPGKGLPASPAKAVKGLPVPPAKAGKGPPAPPTKGGKGLPAPPGKAAPPGKGRPGQGPPGMGRAAMQPTREEHLDWTGKKKNPLRWKRLLHEDGVLDNSLFAGGAEVTVDDESLQAIFTKEAVVRRAVVVEHKEEVVRRPIVWESTEKLTQVQRRQFIAIQMKAWSGDSANAFLGHLRKLELNEIRLDPDFREDRFQQLAHLVDQMNRDGVEWERLAEEGAEARYEWSDFLEGFFRQLHAIASFGERMAALKYGLLVEQELEALSKESATLQAGMQEVLHAEILRVVFLKILSIGNRLNAGDAKFNRADGFDVVELLEATNFLQAYKGAGQVNLLKHLQEKELTEEHAGALRYLAEQLKEISYKPPGPEAEKAVDPTDLAELRKRSNDISRKLGALQQFLESGLASLKLPPEVHAEGAPAVADATRVADDVAADTTSILAQRERLQGFVKLLEGHKKRSIEVESGLDAVETILERLHRFLAHRPPKKLELCAGHSLGVVSQFVRTLSDVHAKKRGSRHTPTDLATIPVARLPASVTLLWAAYFWPKPKSP